MRPTPCGATRISSQRKKELRHGQSELVRFFCCRNAAARAPTLPFTAIATAMAHYRVIPCSALAFRPIRCSGASPALSHACPWLGGNFAQEDAEVVASAKDCLTPLCDEDDRVMPAFSSGQWAGTVEQTYRAVGTTDLLFIAGGGIMAHPGGPAEGIAASARPGKWSRLATTLPPRERATARFRCSTRSLAMPDTQGVCCDAVLWLVQDEFTGATDTLATVARRGQRAFPLPASYLNRGHFGGSRRTRCDSELQAPLAP